MRKIILALIAFLAICQTACSLRGSANVPMLEYHFLDFYPALSPTPTPTPTELR